MYLHHFQGINRALSIEGSPESARRKFELTSLWQSAGRSTEVLFLSTRTHNSLQFSPRPRSLMLLSVTPQISWITLENMEYDSYFKQLIASTPQSKVSKTKLVFFAAGADRHSCWFLAFGDALTMEVFNAPHDPVEADWLFSALRASSSPGNSLGSIMTALQPQDRGGSPKYAAVSVSDLPPTANAGGARPGAINMLGAHVPAEIMAHATGHDFIHIRSLFEYIGANRAMAQAVIVILTHFRPFPWGTNAKGPVHADLDALTAVGVSKAELDCAINHTFGLNSASPPHFLKDGPLWPAVAAAFASMVMYYEEREAAGEMPTVNARLRSALEHAAVAARRSGGGGGGSSSCTVALSTSTGTPPHRKLVQWSSVLLISRSRTCTCSGAPEPAPRPSSARWPRSSLKAW